MRKTCLTAILFLTTSSAFSQKRTISKYEVFFAAPSFLMSYGSSQLETFRVSKIGYFVGVGATHTFSSRFELLSRIFLERGGYQTRQRVNAIIGLDQVIENDQDHDYITIQLQPTYFLDPSRKFQIGLGFYYSTLGSSKYTLREYLNGQLTTKSIVDAMIIYEKYDLGITLSFGYNFCINGNILSVQVVDKIGLKNIQKLTLPEIVEKNHSLSLVLSYMLVRNK